ncbi:hypothetical protein V6N13_086681 [Hibiscus sabdariffa]
MAGIPRLVKVDSVAVVVPQIEFDHGGELGKSFLPSLSAPLRRDPLSFCGLQSASNTCSRFSALKVSQRSSVLGRSCRRPPLSTTNEPVKE